MSRSQMHKLKIQGVDSSGSPLNGGVQSPAFLPPTLGSISPTTKVSVSGGVFTLTCTGSGFTPASKINFAGVDRVTTFVSATSITCSLNCANFAAGTVQAFVKNGLYPSVNKPFIFT